MSDTATVTPWSTAMPYASGWPDWIPEEDQERIAAYAVYQNLYWSEDRSVEVVRRSEDGQPLYVPKPKTIVDTTAHYLLKGLTIGVVDPSKESAQQLYLDEFLKREVFLARFNTAKLKGVALGDWLFHITADPMLPEGRRISLTTVDPGAYFPEYHPDDQETVIAVKLVEQWDNPEDPSKKVVKVLRYWYDWDNPASTTIFREENIWEMEGWNNPQKAKLVKTILPPAALPPEITQIPVYHWMNAEWDGNLFGQSELKGIERVFQGLSQAVSDEELALALVGLGVYATDAGRPVVNGREQDWVIAPGQVLEVPGATMIKRLEGITSVTPVQDHLSYLDKVLKEATQTSDIALGVVEAQVAESGIALAIKFLPTAAKLEYRDQAGLARLNQLWYDMRAWFLAYEGVNFGDTQIIAQIGEKLPLNRKSILDELNNMLDRNVISKAFYRDEVSRKLGYVFPPNEAERILAEKTTELQVMQAAQTPALPPGDGSQADDTTKGDTLPQENQSNNKDRVNESNGSEAGNTQK
jgi:hypothetical protein